MSDVKRVFEIDMVLNEDNELECRVRIEKLMPESVFTFMVSVLFKQIADYIRERGWSNEKTNETLN